MSIKQTRAALFITLIVAVSISAGLLIINRGRNAASVVSQQACLGAEQGNRSPVVTAPEEKTTGRGGKVSAVPPIAPGVAEGKTHSESSLILGRSFFTVKTHLKEIFQRLGVHRRTAAVPCAYRAHIAEAKAI